MKRLLLCGIAALAMPMPAAASCGAAFCPANTSWDVQGAWGEPGGRFDLRYEYIKQDQPMSGSRKLRFGEVPRHHDEEVTRNENWVASLDYTFDEDWGASVVVPLVRRRHEHIHNHGGGQIPQAWKFSELGDVRVLGRRRLASFGDGIASAGTLGLSLGLKLPSGRTDVRNGDRELAEKPLQPGTGTTDLLAGLHYASMLPAGWSWFVQGMYQLPLAPQEDFRPGRRLTLDAGVRKELGERVGAMLQVNFLKRGRDGGLEAEPEDTGGRAIFASPGLSYAFSRSIQAYGFVQIPLYQYVNGVQLVARRAYTLGLNARF